MVVCNPEHGLARRRRVSVEALTGEDFIAFERDIPTRKTIDRILKQRKVKVNYVMEFDNIETIKRSVEVGIGVSILPETAVTTRSATNNSSLWTSPKASSRAPSASFIAEARSSARRRANLSSVLTTQPDFSRNAGAGREICLNIFFSR